MKPNRREAIKITVAAVGGAALPGAALVAPPAALASWTGEFAKMTLAGNTVFIRGSVTAEALGDFLLATGKGQRGASGHIITQCSIVGDWGGTRYSEIR